MKSLEEALGASALLSLREWLNEKFPSEGKALPIVSSRHGLDFTPEQVAQMDWEQSYRIERYNMPNDNREWFRVIDVATGETAIWYPERKPGVRSRLGLKQDLMLSWEEARNAVSRLINQTSRE